MWLQSTPDHVSGENHGPKGYMHPSFHWNTVYNSQDMGATWMSIVQGVDKDDVVHTYSGILLSQEKRMR